MKYRFLKSVTLSSILCASFLFVGSAQADTLIDDSGLNLSYGSPLDSDMGKVYFQDFNSTNGRFEFLTSQYAENGLHFVTRTGLDSVAYDGRVIMPAFTGPIIPEIYMRFAEPVKGFSLDLQSGLNISKTAKTPNVPFTVSVYDSASVLIGSFDLSTCAMLKNNPSSCSKMLLKIVADDNKIGEIIISSLFNLSVDNLSYLYGSIDAPGAKLIYDRKHFNASSTKINFDSFSGSGVLTNQLLKAGLTFGDQNGFMTLYASKFIGSASGPDVVPGAPSGITGTEFIFDVPTDRMGIAFQAGSPFNAKDIKRPSAFINVVAYDEAGKVVLEDLVTSCRNGLTECGPSFIGVASPEKNIKKVQFIYPLGPTMSMDNMIFNRYSKPLPLGLKSGSKKLVSYKR